MSQTMERMQRRERIVLILLDGKRTIRDVARLVHRSELDVARTVVHLLKSGYIEYRTW
jgi:predicted transcriptional regulator